MSETRTEVARLAIEARRQAIADEMAAIRADAEHWNRMHPGEEPIAIDLNLGPDVAAALAWKVPHA